MANPLEITQEARGALHGLLDEDALGRTHVRISIQGFG